MVYKKIFIWETEAIVALDLINLLGKKGFNAKKIEAKEDIVSIISNQQPELFIVCPDSDPELGAKITSIINCLNIPVIILSTISNLKSAGDYDLEFVRFISKPFCEEELVGCIKSILKKKQINARPFNFRNFQHTKEIAEYSFKTMSLN